MSYKIHLIIEFMFNLLVIHIQPILGSISASLAIVYYYSTLKSKVDNEFDGDFNLFFKHLIKKHNPFKKK